MLKTFKYLKAKEWLLFVLLAGLTVLEVWLELKIPDYMTQLTKLMMPPNPGPMSEILKNGGYMLACALGGGLAAVGLGFISAYIGTNLAKRLRGAIYAQVGTFSPTEMHKFSTASLITRSTNDISQFAKSHQKVLSGLLQQQYQLQFC